MQRRSLTPLFAALALAGCGTGYRGLETQHHPLVTAAGASVPGCPDWSDSETNAGEAMASNFGCATQTNLAAMIADPNDLLHGKSAPINAFEVARALKAWRDLQPTGVRDLDKTGAKAAGGGQ